MGCSSAAVVLPRNSWTLTAFKFLQRGNHPNGGRRKRVLARPGLFHCPPPPRFQERQHPRMPHLLLYGEKKVKWLGRVENTEDEREKMREKISAKKEERG